MNFHQLAAIIRKDLRLFLKNRASVILTVLVPVLIASFFGFVTSPKSGAGRGRVEVWLVDGDGSAISREIVAGLSGEPLLHVSTHTSSEAREAVASGAVPVAILFPPDFGEAATRAFLARKGKPSLEFLVDPSHNMESGIAQGLLSRHAFAVIGRHALTPEGADGTAPPAAGLIAPFETKTTPVAGARGAAYNGYAHSFGGMGLQFILMFGIECAVALLMDRKSGLWRRLRATPVSRATVLTGRALSCALISFATLAICWLVSMLVFGVRVHGSWTGFLLVNLATALLAASFALMLAGIGRSVETTRGIAIFAVLMLVMLGGAWVPSFIFPEWLQRVTNFIPTRWVVDGFDAMTWRGLPFSAVALPLVSLTGCILLFGAIAWWRFRWQGE